MAVGHHDVQMGAIGREAAGKAEDLQLAEDRRGLSYAGHAQLSHRQAADGADQAAGLLLLLLLLRHRDVIARLTEHTRFSRPLPGDHWWHHPNAPHVLEPGIRIEAPAALRLEHQQGLAAGLAVYGPWPG